MDELMSRIFDDGNLIFIIGGSIAIIAIVFNAIKSIVTAGARERSRREIAAYIAEGSMTPEQGEKLMNAGARKSC